MNDGQIIQIIVLVFVGMVWVAVSTHRILYLSDKITYLESQIYDIQKKMKEDGER